ncbi:ABC transporter ATP-binding protein [Alicyclobacillus macrosporangiidus]|uniref:ABC-2 type transport system ATP-binding protein n=1 Tax=Alicyclobacillus macrosporangiidus TaxID=392015 RepID=A0A1I7G9F0_9BACL|nr:ABC transporter ATP-binding protein [Alicyclobacillus macrosporangiidus]SFU44906.1 ABC-2 type transport system ATP-binding protein [Alicyclobacillus macrosporangiidus]
MTVIEVGSPKEERVVTETPIVRFEQVSKRYRLRYAVRDLTFSLPSGRIIGMIGANGSGKSTTLKLMAGLANPTSGRVWVYGQEVTRRISRVVSYLSDQDALYPFYTADELISFYAAVFPDFDVAKAREMLDFMQLLPRQRAGELSKGNLGRLKMVLALSRNAPLILMDEPLSGLDPLVRQSILKGLVSFVDLGRQTIVMSTHEVAEIEPLLDTAMLMADGRVVDVRDIDDLRSQDGLTLVDWMASKLAAPQNRR